MFRFVLRPSWVALLLLTVLLAVGFVGLGRWQLDRLDQRRAQNALIAAARDAGPVPVTEVLAGGQPVPRAAVWRRVTATGTYDADDEVLVRGRSVDDRTGLLVLTPLVTADGTALLVARGWVPPSPGGAAAAPDVPAPPQGAVTVTGRVRTSESGAIKDSRGPGSPGGSAGSPDADVVQVSRVVVPKIGELIDRPVFGGYVELVEQQPASSQDLVAIPGPVEEQGPHLSYAVQWFAFAVLALGGYGYLAWRTAQVRRAQVRRVQVRGAEVHPPVIDGAPLDSPPTDGGSRATAGGGPSPGGGGSSPAPSPDGPPPVAADAISAAGAAGAAPLTS